MQEVSRGRSSPMDVGQRTEGRRKVGQPPGYGKTVRPVVWDNDTN